MTAHRHRPEQFARYAPFIGKALKALPNVTVIKPANMSLETFAARFRDAKNAAIEYGYTDPNIDPDLFRLHASDLSVAMEGDSVVIGPLSALRSRKALASTIEAGTVAGRKETEVEITDNVYLPTLCSMIAKRVLNPAPKFVARNLHPQTIQELEQKNDVCFAEDPTEKGKWHII